MERLQLDTERHQRLRRRLVSSLRQKGITDERVLAAIGKLPRHFFVDKAQEAAAYEDRSLPIAEKQTISQPFTVAYQTQLLNVRAGNKVLEIGTGSGYQACILALMGAEVFTLERQKKIFDANSGFVYLQAIPAIHCFYEDGYQGLPRFAPFDRILLTAAIQAIPKTLIDQLGPEGILVAPVGGANGQRMHRIKKEDDVVADELYDQFSFVPMLGGKTE